MDERAGMAAIACMVLWSCSAAPPDRQSPATPAAVAVPRLQIVVEIRAVDFITTRQSKYIKPAMEVVLRNPNVEPVTIDLRHVRSACIGCTMQGHFAKWRLKIPRGAAPTVAANVPIDIEAGESLELGVLHLPVARLSGDRPLMDVRDGPAWWIAPNGDLGGHAGYSVVGVAIRSDPLTGEPLDLFEPENHVGLHGQGITTVRFINRR